ncbi:RHS repeat domain-containing protein [Undibacterium sp.]|uniref:RHS repeat domain-containing protein n=1 Tax=Undibacterium sp. TaxID=1914977 RepID=UPI00273044F1|nr:RHS repeat-associated core domain-containing protein [Undibacterium sp.]MDP1978680.1 RHS repeat-associated core domain-containing protein [Undibacterium sp.]
MISTEGPYGKVTYTYDSFGRCLSQLHNTDTTQYLYQGQCEIGSYWNGELRELRILGKGKGAELGAAIAIEIADKVYAPIHDHFGNVCCLVNSSTGETEQCYRYTAFGEATSHGSVRNPWQYASKRFDELTGFHRFGKRDYDCRLGRWLTPDPAGFTDGPNLYAYVHNCPMTLFDPWGLQGQDLHDRNRAGISGGRRHNPPGVNSCSQRDTSTVGQRSGCLDHNSIAWNGACNPWCERSLVNGLKGTVHGCLDFIFEQGQAIRPLFGGNYCPAYLEYRRNNNDLCVEGFEGPHDDIVSQQHSLKASVDGWVQEELNIDPLDHMYQESRSYMRTAVDIGSVFIPMTCGIGKGLWLQWRSTSKVKNVADRVLNFIGAGGKRSYNCHGDLILESKDGLRQFRMDLNHPAPHKNPHTHTIEYEMRKNRKYEVFNDRVYPSDVMPE